MTNDEVVYSVGINNGLPTEVATWLAAQARLESGQYTSNLFEQCNNAFGYKYVKQAIATQGILAPESEWNNPNIPGYYAAYPDLATSALEIVKWIKRRIKQGVFTMQDISTAEGYANGFKAAGYFGETAYEYYADLVAILKKYFSNTIAYVKNNPGAAILIAFVVIFAVASSKKLIWNKIFH